MRTTGGKHRRLNRSDSLSTLFSRSLTHEVFRQEPLLLSPELSFTSGGDFFTVSESKNIRFLPKQVSTSYTFYCDRDLFESHREKGMVGVLQVSE